MKRLPNKPGSRVRTVKQSLSYIRPKDRVLDNNHGWLVAYSDSAILHFDQPSGRITQTKFAGDRNLDLNQEFPRILDMAPWL